MRPLLKFGHQKFRPFLFSDKILSENKNVRNFSRLMYMPGRVYPSKSKYKRKHFCINFVKKEKLLVKR